MKFILLLLLSSTILLGKSCYMTKNSKVCFKRYYAVNNLKNPVKYAEHYISQNGYIYTFTDKFKITLKYSGAILYILDNNEVEFVDTVNQHTHLLKVLNKNELFSIISILNKLDSVISAKPVLNKVYKKGEIKPKVHSAKKKSYKRSSTSSKSSGPMLEGFK